MNIVRSTGASRALKMRQTLYQTAIFVRGVNCVFPDFLAKLNYVEKFTHESNVVTDEE